MSITPDDRTVSPDSIPDRSVGPSEIANLQTDTEGWFALAPKLDDEALILAFRVLSPTVSVPVIVPEIVRRFAARVQADRACGEEDV